MILLAQRPGSFDFLVGEDAACGGGAGKRIDLDTGAVANVDIVRARAYGEWTVPTATSDKVSALERLSKYGPGSVPNTHRPASGIGQTFFLGGAGMTKIPDLHRRDCADRM